MATLNIYNICFPSGSVICELRGGLGPLSGFLWVALGISKAALGISWNNIESHQKSNAVLSPKMFSGPAPLHARFPTTILGLVLDAPRALPGWGVGVAKKAPRTLARIRVGIHTYIHIGIYIYRERDR